jgi:hypothetical protein
MCRNLPISNPETETYLAYFIIIIIKIKGKAVPVLNEFKY